MDINSKFIRKVFSIFTRIHKERIDSRLVAICKNSAERDECRYFFNARDHDFLHSDGTHTILFIGDIYDFAVHQNACMHDLCNVPLPYTGVMNSEENIDMAKRAIDMASKSSRQSGELTKIFLAMLLAGNGCHFKSKESKGFFDLINENYLYLQYSESRIDRHSLLLSTAKFGVSKPHVMSFFRRLYSHIFISYLPEMGSKHEVFLRDYLTTLHY